MDCVAEGSSVRTFRTAAYRRSGDRRESGVVDVVNYATVDDIGNVVDTPASKARCTAGVLQGVGQVLGEHAIYDSDTGQLLAGSFMDYPMPRATGCAPSAATSTRCRTKANALGAKGVGESGTSGALGATMNAILKRRGDSEASRTSICR